MRNRGRASGDGRLAVCVIVASRYWAFPLARGRREWCVVRSVVVDGVEWGWQRGEMEMQGLGVCGMRSGGSVLMGCRGGGGGLCVGVRVGR